MFCHVKRDRHSLIEIRYKIEKQKMASDSSDLKKKKNIRFKFASSFRKKKKNTSELSMNRP